MELQYQLDQMDQLDQTSHALDIKLITVTTPSLLKKVLNLGLIMCEPEELNGGLQPFVLSQNTAAQSKTR